MVGFNLDRQVSVEKPSLDKLLETLGRKGGGTPYGWHTFATRFQCWYKYHLSEHLKVDRFYSPALAIGTLLHEILASWYSAPLDQDPSVGIERMLDVCRNNGYEKAVDETLRLMEAYLYHWQPAGKVIRDSNGTTISRPDDFFSPGTEIVAVEEMLQTDTPFNYTCRMDLAIKRPDGIWVVDHKTARALDDSVTDWALQGEILGLLWLARKRWGDQVKGLIINLIVKSKTPKFERLSFRLRPRNIEMHLAAIKALLAFQPIAEQYGWPRNLTSCNGTYRCQYFNYCKDGITSDLKHDGKLFEDLVELTPDPSDPEAPKIFGGLDWGEK
jgi:hypothetical protein